MERDIIERKTVKEIGRGKIEVLHVLDDSMDCSWLGEFCEYREPENKNQKLVHRSSGLVLDHYGIWRDKRGRIASEPQSSDWPRRGYWREYEYTFHDNGHERIAYALADNRRLEDLERGEWRFLGIIAKVSYAGREIGEASLWGIESDSGESYFAETEKELIAEALADANAFRKAMVGSK